MYKYYQEVEKEEHMLFAAEIAELLQLKSLTNKPFRIFVSAFLNDVRERSGRPRLFYNTKHGLTQVFSKEDIFILMEKLYESLEHSMNNDNQIQIRVKEKLYTIRCEAKIVKDMEGKLWVG